MPKPYANSRRPSSSTRKTPAPASGRGDSPSCGGGRRTRPASDGGPSARRLGEVGRMKMNGVTMGSAAQTLNATPTTLEVRRIGMNKIGVIALNTFRESVRDRLLYNLVLFVLI